MFYMVRCPNCDYEGDGIGIHWGHSPDCVPSFTGRQDSIIKGLLLGDGSISFFPTKNNAIAAVSTNTQFLEWLKDEFGILSGQICLGASAEYSAQDHRDRGMNPDADPEDYKDVYHWATRSHPEVSNYEHFYVKGENRRISTFPDGLVLDPLSVKVWYCSDGSLDFDDNKAIIKISAERLEDVSDRIISSFENAGFEVAYHADGKIRTNRETTHRLLRWMGYPIPGFEYKWQSEDHDKSYSMRTAV